MQSFLDIINDNALKNETHDYISFTRNYDLVKTSKYFGEHNIRFTFNGDKLSNKFKFEPFNDTGCVKRTNNEQEERIKWLRNMPLHCMFALKRIDILESALQGAFFYSSREEILKIKLPIFFVDNFKPVK